MVACLCGVCISNAAFLSEGMYYQPHVFNMSEMLYEYCGLCQIMVFSHCWAIKILLTNLRYNCLPRFGNKVVEQR